MNVHWKLLVAIILTVGLTFASGILQGRMSRRWGAEVVLAEAGTRLGQLPNQFGEWKLKENQPLGEYAERVLECSGYVNRVYVRETTGESVTVAVIVGPAGPISVHTPDICYSSRDHVALGNRQRASVADRSEDQFWKIRFETTGLHKDQLEVYYAWNSGTGWNASDEPRLSFAGQPYLYKLQLATYLPPATSADETTARRDVAQEFLAQFLPVVDQYLVKHQSTNK